MNKTFQANNPDYNACVGDNGWIDLSTYYEGYVEAVKLLINQVAKRTATVDIIVYPLVYSARHSIELFLKYQIQYLVRMQKIFDSRHSYQLLKTHKISQLWGEFKELAEIEPRYDDLIELIDEYINDFCEIDNTGEVFRYPYPSFNDDEKHLIGIGCIDLSIFGQRFIELSEILT